MWEDSKIETLPVRYTAGLSTEVTSCKVRVVKNNVSGVYVAEHKTVYKVRVGQGSYTTPFEAGWEKIGEYPDLTLARNEALKFKEKALEPPKPTTEVVWEA